MLCCSRLDFESAVLTKILQPHLQCQMVSLKIATLVFSHNLVNFFNNRPNISTSSRTSTALLDRRSLKVCRMSFPAKIFPAEPLDVFGTSRFVRSPPPNISPHRPAGGDQVTALLVSLPKQALIGHKSSDKNEERITPEQIFVPSAHMKVVCYCGKNNSDICIFSQV